MDISHEEILQHLDKSIFKLISQTADEMEVACYVIGGYVRDFFLYRPSQDIDVVVIGSGIASAEAISNK